MAKMREILQIPNHGLVKRVLSSFCGTTSLEFLDEAVRRQARAWFRLGVEHARVARALSGKKTRDWRSVVSRAYYAAYNASRAVRYLVDGQVQMDVTDHKKVGELPRDFPDRGDWTVFLTDLHDARNKSDYDPWPETIRELPRTPGELLSGAATFLRAAAEYLRGRGVRI